MQTRFQRFGVLGRYVPRGKDKRFGENCKIVSAAPKINIFKNSVLFTGIFIRNQISNGRGKLRIIYKTNCLHTIVWIFIRRNLHLNSIVIVFKESWIFSISNETYTLHCVRRTIKNKAPVLLFTIHAIRTVCSRLRRLGNTRNKFPQWPSLACAHRSAGD